VCGASRLIEKASLAVCITSTTAQYLGPLLFREPANTRSRTISACRSSVFAVYFERHHRVLLSSYAGSAFAIVILFLRTPVAQQLSAASGSDLWHQVSLPLLASSVVMMCAWILGIRVVFAIPLKLRANWIFRITRVRPPTNYSIGSRRAAYVLALAPVVVYFGRPIPVSWPWLKAVGHLLVLVLLGIAIVELWLHSLHKIPFTCSCLPRKSNLHVTFLLCSMPGLNTTFWSSEFERGALVRLAEIPVDYCRFGHGSLVCEAANGASQVR
jgi:hypothetical protein